MIGCLPASDEMKKRIKDIEQRMIILPDDELGVDARPIVWRVILPAVNPKTAG